MNELTTNLPTLSIKTYSGLTKLTVGQKVLLKVITEKVIERKSLTWDDIVDCYCKGVKSEYANWEYCYTKQEYIWVYYKVKKAYKDNHWIWTYNLRAKVKQWFLSTIGILVVKNQLAVIPLMEVE
jgi:hypothetical protein